MDDVLSTFISRYIHDVRKQELFVKMAKRAIAAYVGAREIESKFDRREARKLLSETSIALERANGKLQEIAQWRELSTYLKLFHRDAHRTERPEPSSQQQLKQEFQKIDYIDRSYSKFAPDQIGLQLSRLEAVISVAAEKVMFGPGDAQQDQIAQDFTNQLAFAWFSGAETLPTCSRPTRRLKNLSPFARLLTTINLELLEDDHRSANNFLEYGVKSVKRTRQLLGPDFVRDYPHPKRRVTRR